MKKHSTLTTLAAIVVCCVGLGLAAGIAGVGLTPQAPASPTAQVVDPRMGDYAEAQRALEQHLDKRLRLHLARAARSAGH